MGDTLLVVPLAVVAAALIGFFAARPWFTAPREDRVQLERVLAQHHVSLAASMMFLGIVSLVWLALDATATGGLVGPWELPAQLLLVTAAVILGGCLTVVAWQPGWVAAELRRVAVALPLLTAFWGGWIVIFGEGSVPGGALAVIGVVLAISMPMLATSHVLGRDNLITESRVDGPQELSTSSL